MHSAPTLDSRLLAILGQHLRTAHHARPQYGPLPDPWLRRGDGLAALNPQPLPPIDIGALAATEFLRAAWLADRLGFDTKRLVADLDEWCPVPYRAIVKLPPWLHPLPEPVPHPNWDIAFQLGFAMQLAGSALQPATLRELAIDKSVRAIEAALAASAP